MAEYGHEHTSTSLRLTYGLQRSREGAEHPRITLNHMIDASAKPGLPLGPLSPRRLEGRLLMPPLAHPWRALLVVAVAAGVRAAAAPSLLNLLFPLLFLPSPFSSTPHHLVVLHGPPPLPL